METFVFDGVVAHLFRDGTSDVAATTHGPPVRIDGYNVGVVRDLQGSPPHRGEVHPDGDELLYIVSGSIDVVLDDGDRDHVGTETRHRVGPGEAFIVPRGVWHNVVVVQTRTRRGSTFVTMTGGGACTGPGGPGNAAPVVGPSSATPGLSTRYWDEDGMTIGGTLVLIPPGVAQLAAPGAVGPDQAARLVPIVLAIAYSGVLAAAVANVVVFNGVRLLGPTRVITLQSFVPPMAVVLAFVFLHEPIRPAQVVGGLIIVLGVALTRRASVRPVAR